MTTREIIPSTRDQPAQTAERILLVEDDHDVAELVRQLLAEEGYAVERVATAEEAEALFDAQRLDLIIADTMLPGISGWELCRRLRGQPARPYVPILLLTARSALQDRVRGLEAGADDYLTKPFDIDELLAHVRAMLRIRRVEWRLWRHARELEALNAVATTVNSSLDLRQILSHAVTQVTETAEARVGAVWLTDVESGVLNLVAQVGLTDEEAASLARIRRLRTLARRLRRADEPVLLAAGEDDDLLGRAVARLGATLYLPLTSKDLPLGLIALGSDRADAFGPDMVRLLGTLALTVAVAADNARLYAQTRQIADTDPVTGLFNHRYMQDAIEQEIHRSSRSRRPFAVMMMDLDNFKVFNDTYGHPAGDQLLRDWGKTLTAVCRKTDSVGRYGGDEFIVLLPETNAEQAGALADRVSRAASELTQRRGGAVQVSFSIGIAVYPYDSAVRQELIKAADRALYEAKHQGGGRARVAAGGASIASRRADEGPLAHLESLVDAADARTGFSRDHAELSARYAALLARALALPEDEQRAVRIAGLLHDVGNIGIPGELLAREGPLTADERAIVQQHVILSEMLIGKVPYLDAVLAAVLHHHERWDGQGYPRGLAGDDIPLLGRLLAIAGAYAAMAAPRPYRPPLSRAAAVAELERSAGSQFDPALVATFVQALVAQAD
ncbi:MAG: diguanylate cyclase [Chloroflexi bacterium]|nr:diguanylate cyclase [Chloroflexota bacterium]